ncbi:MAG: prepilin peptidase [Caulobacteraceae bacterium]|nr:prepilin peptidase [Caulobacteraceae bacterium]
MTLLQAALLSLFPALLIFAALTDATSFTIPNRISVLLVACYFPTALVLGRPLGEVGIDLAVCAGALVAAMGMFAAGWIGGGDAKLFAAASLWLGWAAAPAFLVVTALAGGLLAVALLNLRAEWLKPYFSGAPSWVVRLATPKAAVPYGVAIAAGALAAFPQSALIHAFHGSF